MALEEIPLIADHIEGLKEPFENDFFCGHNKVEQQFLNAINSNRLHHAWLLTGPKSVGKTSFAFRIARALVEREEKKFVLSHQELDQYSENQSPTFGKIARRAHPNLLHLTIPYDIKTKKFKTNLTIDEVRKTNDFFGTTAGEKGWRIAIIDTADDMTLNAANALLKILEEPPENTIFFLLSSQPKKLLSTIKSRCQILKFEELATADLIKALDHAQIGGSLKGDKEILFNYHYLIGGRVRRAHQFLQNNILPFYESFTYLLKPDGRGDIERLYAFMDEICARGADDKFNFFIDFLESHISNQITAERPLEVLVSWAELWDKVQERLKDMNQLNLDKKQTVFAIFNDLHAK